MTLAGLAGLCDAVHRVCPGFTADGHPIRTATSLLLPGRVGDTAVLAKQPTDPRPFWQNRCRHEIAVYQALTVAGPAPVPAPALIAAGPACPLLIVTRLSGRPLHPDRYPPEPVPAGLLGRLLDALDRLHRWKPAAAFPDDGNYPAQLAVYRGALIQRADVSRIIRLHQMAMPAAQLQHGDAHLGNCLATPAGIALIDLECSAWRPAGYDLAKLWIFLMSSPASRSAILSRLTRTPRELAGFWLAVTVIAAREITSHHRHPGLPGGTERLPMLRGDLREALTQLRQLHSRLT